MEKRPSPKSCINYEANSPQSDNLLEQFHRQHLFSCSPQLSTKHKQQWMLDIERSLNY